MTSTEPMYRIKVVKEDVDRYQTDVEEWKRQYDQLQLECWVWEELIAKANYLFQRYLKLDNDIQHCVLTGRLEYLPVIEEQMTSMLREWLEVSRLLIPHADRIEREYGSADGADGLRANIRAAESMLTPDAEFFSSDKLVSLRDEAIKAHRRGETRTLLDDEPNP